MHDDAPEYVPTVEQIKRFYAEAARRAREEREARVDYQPSPDSEPRG
jgi:hypothetical protein